MEEVADNLDDVVEYLWLVRDACHALGVTPIPEPQLDTYNPKYPTDYYRSTEDEMKHYLLEHESLKDKDREDRWNIVIARRDADVKAWNEGPAKRKQEEIRSTAAEKLRVLGAELQRKKGGVKKQPLRPDKKAEIQQKIVNVHIRLSWGEARTEEEKKEDMKAEQHKKMCKKRSEEKASRVASTSKRKRSVGDENGNKSSNSPSQLRRTWYAAHGEIA
jgi:hypothetical protein